jgi:hypothetical protein
MGKAENIVVNACTRVLDLHGIPWVRLNSGMAWAKKTGGGMRPMVLGKTGWPDLLCILPGGRTLGIEAKRPEVRGLFRKRPAGTRSPEQIAVHNTLIKQGALIITCTSGAELSRDLRDEGYYT